MHDTSSCVMVHCQIPFPACAYSVESNSNYFLWLYEPRFGFYQMAPTKWLPHSLPCPHPQLWLWQYLNYWCSWWAGLFLASVFWSNPLTRNSVLFCAHSAMLSLSTITLESESISVSTFITAAFKLLHKIICGKNIVVNIKKTKNWKCTLI